MYLNQLIIIITLKKNKIAKHFFQIKDVILDN